MTNTFKALIAGSALIALSGTAFAGEPSATTFTYNASAPTAVTYERFQKAAESVCEISLRDAGGLVAKTRVENKCRAQMVGDAVKATKIKSLITYHNQQMKLQASERQLASLRSDTSTN